MGTSTLNGDWESILLPMIEEQLPQIPATDLNQIQPMFGPTGLIYSIKPKYEAYQTLARDAAYDDWLAYNHLEDSIYNTNRYVRELTE